MKSMRMIQFLWEKQTIKIELKIQHKNNIALQKESFSPSGFHPFPPSFLLFIFLTAKHIHSCLPSSGLFMSLSFTWTWTWGKNDTTVMPMSSTLNRLEHPPP